MYLERTFIVRTGVVGLEYVYKKHKKSTCRLYSLKQNNSLISYTVCPIYLSRRTLDSSISPRNSNNNNDKRQRQRQKTYYSTFANLLPSLSTTAILPYSLSTSFLHALLSRLFSKFISTYKLILSPPKRQEETLMFHCPFDRNFFGFWEVGRERC